MISNELLSVLVCPENRTSLEFADATLLAAVNRAVAAGKLTNKGGEAVTGPLEMALVRQDRAVLYPVVDEIPILLLDAGIPLDQIELPSSSAE